jgi:hypothetical protein
MMTLLALGYLVLTAVQNEEVIYIPLDVGPQRIVLEGSLFKPSGVGPFPLVIISHGAEGKASPGPRWRPVEQARWFVERGFVVVVPMRRGNSNSEGAWAEGFGSCDDADYLGALFETARDILGTLDFMATLSAPWPRTFSCDVLALCAERSLLSTRARSQDVRRIPRRFFPGYFCSPARL